MRQSPLTGLFLGVAILYIVLVGALLGSSIAYDADTRDDATIEYNGTHIITADETIDVQLDWDEVEENSEENQGRITNKLADVVESYVPGASNEPDERVERMVRSFTESMYYQMMALAIGVANLSATFFYYLSPVIPQPVTSAFFSVAAIGPVLVLGYALLQRLGRMVS